MGATVFSIRYHQDWYKDAEKEAGGWTLEMIDATNPCGEASNWTAAEATIGGTPGSTNSVAAERPDLTAPKLISAYAQDEYTAWITFNEKMDSLSLVNGTYIIGNGHQVIEKTVVSPAFAQVIIQLPVALSMGETQPVTVEGVEDCNGNPIDREYNQVMVVLPEPGDSTDIILNEVLFNPKPGGVDFVELYNASEKYIDLQGWRLANVDDTGTIANPELLATDQRVIAPKSHLAFTSSIDRLIGDYPFAQEENLVEIQALPGYPDDEGTVLLLNPDALVFDRFDYHEDLHSPFISDRSGVSLERVTYHSATNHADNWKSAASTSGYATPGKRNSQARENISYQETIAILPEVFSPDNDGSDDFVMITYQLGQPGYVANVWIYDVYGRAVKRLASNDLLAAEGFYTWDGTHENGQKVNVGNYIVLFEAFNDTGEKKAFKKRIAVAARF